MSKIICDVCGTSYPETANQCPICGCAKSVAGDTLDTGASYTYVKGGRFSTKNVRKRNRAAQMQVPQPVEETVEQPENEKKDKGLVITAIALLLVIIAVVIYIAMRFFVPGAGDKETTAGVPDTSYETTVAAEGSTGPVEIACQDLKLTDAVVELDKAGAAWLLSVTPVPADTTDEITFTSSDPTVASVTSGGKIIAQSAGQTFITVTCGDVEKECRVVCTFEDETTAATTETTVPADETFKLNREDFTLANKGDTWTLYTGDIPASLITWSVDDAKVVTVENGKVTAVGPGYTTVRAVYNGTEVKCIVRCGFTETNTGSGGIAGTGGVSEDGGQVSSGKSYEISHDDVTIRVGETFTLSLSDAAGTSVSVSWSSANSGVSSVSGSTVTGVASGMTTISGTYEGVTYTCIVRVN